MDRSKIIATVFVIAYLLAIALDLYLVFTGQSSISLRTWCVTRHHPTTIAAGVLWGISLCWLVRRYWGLCAFQGIMTGHLFVHF